MAAAKEEEVALGGDRKTKTILVTGGGGFIGSHTVEALLTRGDDVVLVDELNSHGYSNNVKEASIAALQHVAKKKGRHLSIVRADLADPEALAVAFASTKHRGRSGGGPRVTAVCHLGGRSGARPSLERPDLYAHANVTGTTVLLDLAAKSGVENFVYASSGSVYGSGSGLLGGTGQTFGNQEPQGTAAGEALFRGLREDDPLGTVLSPYGATKRAVEEMAGVFHRLYGMPITGLRFFTVYGPRGRPDMAPFIFIDRISRGLPILRFGDGRSWRDYTYVADAVAAVLAALDQPQPLEIFNIGSGTPVRLNDFITAVEEALDRKAVVEERPEPPADMTGTLADISKAQAVLGFNPKVTLKEGLRETVAWYREARGTGPS